MQCETRVNDPLQHVKKKVSLLHVSWYTVGGIWGIMKVYGSLHVPVPWYEFIASSHVTSNVKIIRKGWKEGNDNFF